MGQNLKDRTTGKRTRGEEDAAEATKGSHGFHLAKGIYSLPETSLQGHAEVAVRHELPLRLRSRRLRRRA